MRAGEPPTDPDDDARARRERLVEHVLRVVESVPPGRVTTYGAVAAVVGGGPRRVGSVLAQHGGPVPWWRVVRADGTLPPSHGERAASAYRREGTPRRTDGRPDLRAAFWDPAADD
ncbi:MGMT family protein [Nocardioides sp.]|uniref:MGMT family protein n=1 Tax=Nocardioides sp. TaxID=35761 RepID=UPI0035166636